MHNNKNYLLKFKHKDFICKQLALFKTHRQVAEELLSQFPQIPLSLDEIVSRIEYYSSSRRRTERWVNRIRQYRSMLEHDFPNRFRLVNKHQRMMELERIFNEAMTPKLRRILWFPVSRAPDGSITYGQKEVFGPDLRTAISVLLTIPRELDDLSYSIYTPPVDLTKPLSTEEIRQAFKKALKKLDLHFGLR